VLVNGHTLVNKDGKNIAELYVKKEFRKNGIGKMISFRVFDLFKGNWEVRQIKENILAQKFWKKVIGEYTNNNYQEIILDDENWCGFVQTFKN
jgi:predicted acetyltransferase